MSDERRQGQPKPPSEEPVRKPGPASEYDLSRQKKVESFQLNLDLDEGEDQNFGLPPVEELPKEEPPASAEGQPSEILSSYSEEYAEKKKKAMTAEERKAEKQALKAEKKRKKKKAKKNGCLFKMIWAVMIVLVSVVLAQYILVGVNDIFAINRLDEETISVELPKDASVEEVAGILADKGVINRADFFTLYAKLTKSGGFSNGSFNLRGNMDYEAIINYLQVQSNRTDTVFVTFREGMTQQQIGELLEENNVCTAEDFYDALENGDYSDYNFAGLVPDEDLRFRKYEGYIFPDTYEFYTNMNAEEVVRRFFDNFDTKVDSEVMQRIRNLSNGLGELDNLITLASIIQREATDLENMRMVSSVFHNRLNNSSTYPYLQSDATTNYIQDDIRPFMTEDNQEMYDAYDTTKVVGLPVGPICNPGMDAIEAAIDPAETDYYYFVSDDAGNYYFATTLEEHEANIRTANQVNAQLEQSAAVEETGE